MGISWRFLFTARRPFFWIFVNCWSEAQVKTFYSCTGPAIIRYPLPLTTTRSAAPPGSRTCLSRPRGSPRMPLQRGLPGNVQVVSRKARDPYFL
jgi:hypothetical protein